jgi:hypothetical protein
MNVKIISNPYLKQLSLTIGPNLTAMLCAKQAAVKEQKNGWCKVWNLSFPEKN